MAYNNSIDWKKAIKEEAKGFDGAGLGEVQAVLRDTVITKSDVVDKKAYAIPRNLVEKFDDYRLLLRITKEEAESLQGQGITT
jgi:hypothetical protein